MSALDVLLGEYEITADSFDVNVPTPGNAEAPFVILTFHAWRTFSASEAASSEAAKMAAACPVEGDKVEPTCVLYGSIAGHLPKDREHATRIGLLTVALKEPAIPFIRMVKLCANRHLFDYLWSQYQEGQKTVYAKLVDVSIETAKKKWAGGDGSSSAQSGISDAQSTSQESTE